MNILTVEHVKKSYGLRVLFDDVTFAIDGGQKLGLIGLNGAGKTTLMRMLCTLLALGGISTLAATIPPANATHNTPETAVLMILPIILLSFFFCAITVNSFSFVYTTRFIAVLRSASTPLLDVILSYKPQNEPFSAQSVVLDA